MRTSPAFLRNEIFDFPAQRVVELNIGHGCKWSLSATNKRSIVAEPFET